ncbi:EF-hand domain-containing protein [Rhodanobacter sp. DHG33]|uniref:EF-hand domain-containing protein n=1 Tax=Rhodanobacter sp. DHG33 TaxID=2775921 RepID=UPI00177AD784|nr:EF-hand domain-containing protein [Rhodanobacter sp. DHG33]MBD8900037.1 EF-hand domain-containing protein [Rhodanobacter sp. DHG33]
MTGLASQEIAMPRLALVFGLVLLATGLPVCLHAQTGLNGIVRGVTDLDKSFDAADRNHDGKLSKAEAQAGSVAFITTHFDAIDVHHTGFVTKADVHAYIAHMLMRSQPAPGSSAGKPR